MNEEKERFFKPIWLTVTLARFLCKGIESGKVLKLPSNMKRRNLEQYEILEQDQSTKEKQENETSKVEKNPLLIPFKFNGYDIAIIVLLLFVGVFSRFWRIYQPRDFCLFENQTLYKIHQYNSKDFFFDESPPLGGLIIYFQSKKMEYNFQYNLNPPQPFVIPSTVYVSIRSISAFCSMVTIPLLFVTLRLFGCTRFISFFGSFLCLIEPSLISTGRLISVSGLMQLFGIASILFASLSHHFVFDSIHQKATVIFQAIFASFGLSTSYHCLAYVVFAILWPYLRFGCKKQMIINMFIIISIFIFFITVHLLYLPTINSSYSKQFSQNFVSSSTPSYRSLSLQHIIMVLEFLFKQLKDVIFKSIKSLRITKIFRSLLMLDKWILLWKGNGSYSVCYINRIQATAAATLAYIQMAHYFLMKTFDMKTMISFFFIFAMTVNGLLYHYEESTEMHVTSLIGIVSLAINMNGRYSDTTTGFVLTMIMVLSLLQFLDWSQIIYAYENIRLHLSPYIKLN